MPIGPLVSSTHILKLGDQGPSVIAVQLALKRIGFALSGSGYFGPGTDTAVSAFQKRVGLPADGEVGPRTAAAIDLEMGKLNRSGATQLPLVGTAPQEVSRPLWLEAGIKLIGTKEDAGAQDNPAIIEWAKDLGPDVAKEYTHDSIPWCALFANHCLACVGIKGTGGLWALDFDGHWPSVQLPSPAVGAFAPMVRSGGGHIIQVVGRDQHGNIMGLGGNQADRVSIEPFSRTRLNKGFWWPKSVPVPPASQMGFNQLPLVNSEGTVSTSEA